MLRPASDPSQVDWLLEHSADNPPVVQSYVSSGFEAYARVLNPATGIGGEPVRWSSIAKKAGVEFTAETRWSELAALLEREALQDRLYAPDWSPDPTVAQAVTGVLEPYAAAHQVCYFLVWEGYAGLDEWFADRQVPRIAMSPDRSLLLLTGSVQDTCRPFMNSDPRRPNWYWPAGHEWCVGTDIYARSAYLGGSRECVDAVLNHPDLEAYSIPASSLAYGELE